MEIHIGSIINKIALDRRVKSIDLAKKIGKHPVQMVRIYKYPSVQTKLLKKISVALDYDFFTHFSDNLKLAKGMDAKSETEKLLAEKNAEVEILKKEISYLKQINDLLMKK